MTELTADEVKEIIVAHLQTTVTTPEPGTGYVDPCEEAKASILREVLAEIRRREAME